MRASTGCRGAGVRGPASGPSSRRCGRSLRTPSQATTPSRAHDPSPGRARRRPCRARREARGIERAQRARRLDLGRLVPGRHRREREARVRLRSRRDHAAPRSRCLRDGRRRRRRRDRPGRSTSRAAQIAASGVVSPPITGRSARLHRIRASSTSRRAAAAYCDYERLRRPEPALRDDPVAHSDGADRAAQRAGAPSSRSTIA